jgi:hypothetical protein
MVVNKPNTVCFLSYSWLVYIHVPPSDNNQSIFVALSRDSSAGHSCASTRSEYRRQSTLIENNAEDEREVHGTDTPRRCTYVHSTMD